MSLYHELKRRNVIRVAIAYLAGSWLLVEVSETLFPIYGLPDAAVRLVVTVLAIGFPLLLIFSWVFEFTPEGLKLEKDINPAVSVSQHTGKKLDRVIIVLLALALGYFAVDKFVLEPARVSDLVEETARQARSESLVESYGDKSIAVLPFVNMSAEPEQEYFSDGISEELLNLLAKIPELRVISRSSAFFFKGKDVKLADVARDLNVAHILEGSVRKAGNRVRITAQLIEARSDSHLWSESYDRELDDIFAIQDEIAAEVVAQLKVTLLGAAPVVHETDPQAYAMYLQGRHLRQQMTAEGNERAQALLQQALAIDPGFAAAWEELGSVYFNQVPINQRPIDEGYTLAREAINKALAINPDYALAHAGLGSIAMIYDSDLATATRHFERALQLEPANTVIIISAAHLTALLGRPDEALALIEFAVSRDPVNPISHFILGSYYLNAERWDEGIASLRIALMLSPDSNMAQYLIGMALLLKGEPQAALEVMQLEDSVLGRIGLPMAYHALGKKDESDAALAALIEQDERDAAYGIACVLAYRGETDRAFEWLDKAAEYKDMGLTEIMFQPQFANIRDDPRWQPFLESIGKSPEQLDAIEFKVTLPE